MFKPYPKTFGNSWKAFDITCCQQGFGVVTRGSKLQFTPAEMSMKILSNFYRCAIECILTGCTLACYGNFSALH